VDDIVAGERPREPDHVTSRGLGERHREARLGRTDQGQPRGRRTWRQALDAQRGRRATRRALRGRARPRDEGEGHGANGADPRHGARCGVSRHCAGPYAAASAAPVIRRTLRISTRDRTPTGGKRARGRRRGHHRRFPLPSPQSRPRPGLRSTPCLASPACGGPRATHTRSTHGAVADAPSPTRGLPRSAWGCCAPPRTPTPVSPRTDER
jgi:hypothetical protein